MNNDVTQSNCTNDDVTHLLCTMLSLRMTAVLQYKGNMKDITCFTLNLTDNTNINNQIYIYIYIYICMYVCMYIYIYIHLIYLFIICMSVCLSIWAHQMSTASYSARQTGRRRWRLIGRACRASGVSHERIAAGDDRSPTDYCIAAGFR